MDAKLTLKLDKSVIEKAKEYAAEKEISLSKIIEFYLQSLTSKKDHQKERFELTPFVKSIATERKVAVEVDDDKEITDYLMEKYL